jgi:hypothetical protein
MLLRQYNAFTQQRQMSLTSANASGNSFIRRLIILLLLTKYNKQDQQGKATFNERTPTNPCVIKTRSTRKGGVQWTHPHTVTSLSLTKYFSNVVKSRSFDRIFVEETKALRKLIRASTYLKVCFFPFWPKTFHEDVMINT